MNPLDLIVEPLQYDFMLRALAATSLAAVVCALLSCWLVLIGWSLMGDAVSHAVLLGIAVLWLAAVGWSVLQHRSGSHTGSVSEATTADEVAKPTAAAASGSSAAQCPESVHSAR